jgi:hypothetical protein
LIGRRHGHRAGSEKRVFGGIVILGFADRFEAGAARAPATADEDVAGDRKWHPTSSASSAESGSSGGVAADALISSTMPWLTIKAIVSDTTKAVRLSHNTNRCRFFIAAPPEMARTHRFAPLRTGR